MPDRQLTILDPSLDARYAACVAAVAPRIERALGQEVLANRAAVIGRRGGLTLQPWRPARDRFLAAARRHAGWAEVMLVADVRSCYPSIGPSPLAETLRSLGCPRDEVDDVLRVLDRIHRLGVPGLPIGPDPSALLANAALTGTDRALSRVGVRHLRWVDDVWAFTSSRVAAELALETMQASLERVGLRVAKEKTAIVGDPGAIDAIVRGGRVSTAAMGPSYHPRSDAHALPSVCDPHVVVSADGGVDPGGWAPRAAGRHR